MLLIVQKSAMDGWREGGREGKRRLGGGVLGEVTGATG